MGSKMTENAFVKMWNILKHNEDDFQIDDEIKKKYICTSCKNILIKACNVPCGCRYCVNCLISYLNGEEKFCLGESDDCKRLLIKFYENVSNDQAVNKDISRIIVKCPSESCDFKTELGKIADHMETCDKQPVACPYCAIGCVENKIDVDSVKQHFEREHCSHVRLFMDFINNWKNEMKLLKTNMLKLQEENKCIRKQMASKQKTILALEENIAKLLQENVSLKELEIHQNNQIEKMILAMQTKEKQNQGIKANQEKLEELNEKYDEKCNQIKKNQDQVKTRIDKMSQENADMTTRSNKIENPIKILEAKLAQVEINIKLGEYLWCIQNWEKKKERVRNGMEKFIYSNGFYSHTNGYKMCLALYPNGKSSGKGTHLSIFICILQGEFDNWLEWPFRHGIKIELLNQETGLAHVSEKLSYRHSPTNHAWKKPISERNSEYGCEMFIELSELSSNPSLCQANQIWIKAGFVDLYWCHE